MSSFTFPPRILYRWDVDAFQKRGNQVENFLNRYKLKVQVFRWQSAWWQQILCRSLFPQRHRSIWGRSLCSSHIHLDASWKMIGSVEIASCKYQSRCEIITMLVKLQLNNIKIKENTWQSYYMFVSQCLQMDYHALRLKIPETVIQINVSLIHINIIIHVPAYLVNV